LTDKPQIACAYRTERPRRIFQVWFNHDPYRRPPYRVTLHEDVTGPDLPAPTRNATAATEEEAYAVGRRLLDGAVRRHRWTVATGKLKRLIGRG
jgi:hypothetical protein